MAPPVPHEPLVSAAKGSQVPLAVQHPSGQEVASQTHLPLALHSCPAAHAPHAAPAAPHEALVSLASGSHVEPLQHPVHDAPPQEHVPAAHA